MPWQWILVELWLVWISVREPRLHSNLKRTPPVPADQRRCASQRLREEALRGRLRVPGSALSTVLVCQRHRGIQGLYSVQNPSHDQKCGLSRTQNAEIQDTEYRIEYTCATLPRPSSLGSLSQAQSVILRESHKELPLNGCCMLKRGEESRHSAESSRQRKSRDKGYGYMQSSGEARPWASELTSARHGQKVRKAINLQHPTRRDRSRLSKYDSLHMLVGPSASG